MRNVHVPNPARALMLAATLAAIAGCTGGKNDLQQWVAQEKAKKGTPVAPLPVLKTFETFVYQDQDKRDPFGPSLEEQREAQASANGPMPDKHPREQLESYPLDSLKMVGTIGTGTTIEGLIKDPDGVIHRVHVNNYMGQNNGKITAVAEDHIDLVELIPNGSGGWMKRQASVALGEK
ncbi:MAG: pilus assembly protein PilP [Proteobacteria bacterium]|nr:pilus assembly protein PilP [Pseudomonadota bacterium]